tara:strand:- start:1227 stop:2270 length:1044 start_codon:yes stop_codon:yes gene_type:complete
MSRKRLASSVLENDRFKIRRKEFAHDVGSDFSQDKMRYTDLRTPGGCVEHIRMNQHGGCSFTSMFNSFGLCLPIRVWVQEDEDFMERLKKTNKSRYSHWNKSQRAVLERNIRKYADLSWDRAYKQGENLTADEYTFVNSGTFADDFFVYILNKYNKPKKYYGYTTWADKKHPDYRKDISKAQGSAPTLRTHMKMNRNGVFLKINNEWVEFDNLNNMMIGVQNIKEMYAAMHIDNIGGIEQEFIAMEWELLDYLPNYRRIRKLTADELRDELEDAGLPTDGRKAELVKRREDHETVDDDWGHWVSVTRKNKNYFCWIDSNGFSLQLDKQELYAMIQTYADSLIVERIQ